MARDSFLLRTDPRTMAALRKWADDELRSVNGQIEFVLRRALREAGRLAEVEIASRAASDETHHGGPAAGLEPGRAKDSTAGDGGTDSARGSGEC